MQNSSLVTRNVRIRNRRTSVRLEPELWRALEAIAHLDRVDVNDVCARVAETRGPKGGYTSALRVHIVEYFGGDAIRRALLDVDRLRVHDASYTADATAAAPAPEPEPDQRRRRKPRAPK